MWSECSQGSLFITRPVRTTHLKLIRIHKFIRSWLIDRPVWSHTSPHDCEWWRCYTSPGTQSLSSHTGAGFAGWLSLLPVQQCSIANRYLLHINAHADSHATSETLIPADLADTGGHGHPAGRTHIHLVFAFVADNMTWGTVGSSTIIHTKVGQPVWINLVNIDYWSQLTIATAGHRRSSGDGETDRALYTLLAKEGSAQKNIININLELFQKPLWFPPCCKNFSFSLKQSCLFLHWC